MKDKHCAKTVLAVRPRQFAANPQTATTNAFQNVEALSGESSDAGTPLAQKRAQGEFDNFVTTLTHAGVEVIVIDDDVDTDTPDAIFPNNWLTTHADGTVVLYPMCAPNRRLERRADIIDALQKTHHFNVSSVLDLSHYERDEAFLEGTGSLVLDRHNRIAYACLSARTDPNVLEDWAQKLGYQLITFNAQSRGLPIYHTNVMMTLGRRFACVCLEAIPSAQARQQVEDSLVSTGHDIIAITHGQMAAFAGNMLELQTRAGEAVVVMSERAYEAFSKTQRQHLREYAQLVSAPLTTIEDLAGGSARCILAEIFLPRNTE